MTARFGFVLLGLMVSWPVFGAAKNPAAEPAQRDDRWVRRHNHLIDDVKAHAGKVDVLFVGDAIVDNFREAQLGITSFSKIDTGGGKTVWEEQWKPLNALNIGVAGDRTEHILWRLQNGGVAGIKPKVVVVLAGAANLLENSDEQIAGGVKAVVQEVRKQLPEAKVLLMGIFPRGYTGKDPMQVRVKNINTQIAKLDDGGKTTKYLDIGNKFLDDKGGAIAEMMPDRANLNTKGYRVWTESIKGVVEGMMKK